MASPSKGSSLSTFADLGASPESVATLTSLGITDPFPIQQFAIPVALEGTDVIGQARTGTGKTLAFGVPLVDRIDLSPQRPPKPQALVVVPTRELCLQVTGDLERLGKPRGVRVTPIFGGRAMDPQINALKAGVDVVVGTPGRLLDLARQRHLDLGAVRMLVLDEADEMLDLGFLPDVEKILSLTPAGRQTMLFSATMPGPILTLSRRFLDRPVHIRAEQAHEEMTVPTTRQHVFRAHALDKPEMLARILQADGRGLTMVFVRTKRGCDKLGADLAERGFAAAAVHGDLPQVARERVLRAFRAGKIDVLVATDVAARGIDVAGVTHVINYQCPEDEKTYLHRIGRTGRAGESGVAVTLVDWEDLGRWDAINAALRLPFADLPETYSTSAHLREALDIPASATGRLPRAQRTRAGLDAEAEDTSETFRRPARAHGGRGGAAAPAAAAPAGTTGERPAPKRGRRRTRGGVNAAAETGPTRSTRGADAATPPAGDAATPAAANGTPRRRRRRGGSGRTATATVED